MSCCWFLHYIYLRTFLLFTFRDVFELTFIQIPLWYYFSNNGFPGKHQEKEFSVCKSHDCQTIIYHSFVEVVLAASANRLSSPPASFTMRPIVASHPWVCIALSAISKMAFDCNVCMAPSNVPFWVHYVEENKLTSIDETMLMAAHPPCHSCSLFEIPSLILYSPGIREYNTNTL